MKIKCVVDGCKCTGKTIGEVAVLDKGFVRLVDSLGNDTRIVQAARVSYGAGSKGDEKDRKLIAYMMAHGHSSPFEQVVFTFHMKLPLFVRSQIVRHRTARINELSMRYTEAKDEFYFPTVWRAQDAKNKQGSIEAELQHRSMTMRLEAACGLAMNAYCDLLKYGASREMARIVLPVNLYTEWYWQIDLSNLFKFLEKRLDVTAQWETREYAKAIYDLAQPIAPWAFEAWGKRS